MIGAYYYPEQWPEEQWQRDIENIARMGMRQIHLAEFSWIHLQPEMDTFNFSWLDKAIELASKNNLEVILCTPTAAPPIWLSSNYPEILMVKDSAQRVNHGSRAHRCVNSDTFIYFSEIISKELGVRYGSNPAVVGWQLDNEIGHYGESGCYCDSCREKFIHYLFDKYGNIDGLNHHWGCDFWSQNYQSFDQIELPNAQNLAYFPNEHALLDFRIFYSLSLSRFLQNQSRLLRKHIEKRMWVTHNFMMNDRLHFPGHLDVNWGEDSGEALDHYCMTIYPVAGNTRSDGESELGRIGNPYEIAQSHDQARSFNGRWGILEQQPGQVNWGPHNTRPFPGSTRLWLWTGLAHGAEILNTYRYRQPRSGCEQYHEGLTALDGFTLSQGGRDFSRVAEELQRFEKMLFPENGRQPATKQKRIALCMDWESLTSLSIHPQSVDFKPYEILQYFYQSFKRLGLAVDFLYPQTIEKIFDYEIACIVLIDLADDNFFNTIQSYVERGGHLILSPRNLSRMRNGHFPEERYSTRIEKLCDCRFLGYDVMPQNCSGKIRLIADNKILSWSIWSEQVEPARGSEIFAIHADQFYQGATASFTTVKGDGRISYIGFVHEEGINILMQRYIAYSLPNTFLLPAKTLFNQQGNLGIFMNYNDKKVIMPHQLLIHGNLIQGEMKVAPADVAIIDYSF